MTSRQPPFPEEQPDPQTRPRNPGPGDERRHHRPEDPPKEPRPVFTDWASI